MASKLTVRWSPHARLSAVHAAYLVASGAECVDAKTEQALLEPATSLNNRLLSASVDMGEFWRRLVAETAGNREDGDRLDLQTSEMALLAAGLSEMQLEHTGRAVARRVGECRAAFHERFPKLVDQLRLRGKPIQERWEIYGLGLLRMVAQRIWQGAPPADWWPTRVESLLIQPVRGGDGGYDARGDRIWVEAMLTDADASVPEVLRVVWLITRMGIEAHTRERSGEYSTTLPWGTGTVPIVLAAAADLELIPPGPLPIRAAIQRWHLGGETIAAVVDDWWQQSSSSGAPMPVALKALARMLEPVLRTPEPVSENLRDTGEGGA